MFFGGGFLFYLESASLKVFRWAAGKDVGAGSFLIFWKGPPEKGGGGCDPIEILGCSNDVSASPTELFAKAVAAIQIP